MKENTYVQITFQVKRETGVVSFLMLNAGKFGLLYTKKFERQNDDNNTSHVVAYYSGKAEATDNEIKDSFLKHPGVTEVEDISIVSVADMRTRPRPDVVHA